MRQNFKASFFLSAVLTALCTYLCTQSVNSSWISECLGAQYAVIAFCPFVYYILAKYINIGDKIGLTPFFCDFALFNIIAGFSVWLFQEKIFYRPYFAADTSSEIYMYITAIGAFFICRTREDKPSKMEIILSLALIITTVCLWLYTNPRVQEIIESLCLPWESRDAEGEFVNWLSLRKFMAELSVTGNLSQINPYYIKEVINFCPIAAFLCLGSSLRVLLLLAVVAFQSALAVTYAVKCKKPLNTFVAFVFVARTVMGLASNLFLIFSSRVTVPFTVTPFDIAIILAIIAKNRKKNS